jgi:hypothetical protein
MEPILDLILLVIAGADLWPEVGDSVVPTQLKRDEVVHLVAARRVRFDPVLRVDAPLERLWDVAN